MLSQNVHSIFVGMTLKTVVLEAGRVFAAGQLGVGMGRVRDKAELRVINYKQERCPKHEEAMSAFYEESMLLVNEKLTCCRSIGMHVIILVYI